MLEKLIVRSFQGCMTLLVLLAVGTIAVAWVRSQFDEPDPLRCGEVADAEIPEYAPWTGASFEVVREAELVSEPEAGARGLGRVEPGSVVYERETSEAPKDWVLVDCVAGGEVIAGWMEVGPEAEPSLRRR